MIKPVALFYNLFACSNARYVESDYMAGWYIFQRDYGIAAIGSTKSGSMLEFDDFYYAVQQYKILGKGYLKWHQKWANTSPAWFYGMTLLGDPLLPVGDGLFYYSHTIDDDNTGASMGDGDGKPDASETIEMPVKLINFCRSDITGGTAVLTCQDPYLELIDSEATFKQIESNSMRELDDPFVVKISPSCPDSHDLTFTLKLVPLTGGAWSCQFKDTCYAPEITLNTCTYSEIAGDGDGAPDADEKIALATEVSNQGSENISNLYLILESNDPFVEVQQDSVFVGGVKSGQKVAPAESFVLFVKPDCPCPHDAQMTLNMKNDKGYTNSRNINFRSGHSSLLLVDDDAGSDYEKYFIDALDMLSVDYDLWDRNSLGRIGAYGTLNYKKMIWFTGDSKENTLDENDRIDIETFFNKNGLLILTGQDIGHEIGFLSFYRNFLHAGLIRDDENKYVVEGDAEDPVFKDFVFPIIGHGGANNQKSPSSINAIEGAKVFLNYVEGEGAGIAYKGSYTLFYLSFGLEAIPSLEVRTSVLGLMLGVKGIENPGKRPPAAKTSTHLSQNYPNPFNPVTTIDFTSSQRGMVSIKIYNIKGELVKILLEKILEQGNYSVQWDGFNQYNEPCSSGIYFYKMSAGKCDYNRKMLLLK